MLVMKRFDTGEVRIKSSIVLSTYIHIYIIVTIA